MRWPWQGHRWDAWPWWNPDDAGIELRCRRCGMARHFHYDTKIATGLDVGLMMKNIRDLLEDPRRHDFAVADLVSIAGFGRLPCRARTEVAPAAAPPGRGSEAVPDRRRDDCHP